MRETLALLDKRAPGGGPKTVLLSHAFTSDFGPPCPEISKMASGMLKPLALFIVRGVVVNVDLGALWFPVRFVFVCVWVRVFLDSLPSSVAGRQIAPDLGRRSNKNVSFFKPSRFLRCAVLPSSPRDTNLGQKWPSETL